MKRKAFFACALIAALCLGKEVAFAAPSPTAEDTGILAATVEVEEGTGTISELPLELLTEANHEARLLVAKIISSAQTKAEHQYAEDGTLILTDESVPLGTSAEPELLAAFDFVPSESVKEQIEKKGKAEITFEVEGVLAGDCIKVLHFVNGEWEVIEPSSVKDGKVTASFTSFSPIVFTKLTPEVADLDTASKGINFYVVVAITLLAIAAIAVVFAFGNKKKPVKAVKRK
ncbi:MAG: hypothetical protein K6G60_05020 [Lachnospiraceae bacterium]|nr:hypothetical protein [Lachnospiraceae bacterium]